MGHAQLIARLAAAALPAQPLPVQQMSAGQLDADAGPAQPLDGLPVQALGLLSLAQQRLRARLDPQSPGGAADGGHLGEPPAGVSGRLGLPAARGRLDQLNQSPVGVSQLGMVLAGPLGGCQRFGVGAQAVVQHGGGPLGGRYRQPFAAPWRIPQRGLDQPGCRRCAAAHRSQPQRAVGREIGPGRL